LSYALLAIQLSDGERDLFVANSIRKLKLCVGRCKDNHLIPKDGQALVLWHNVAGQPEGILVGLDVLEFGGRNCLDADRHHGLVYTKTGPHW